MSERKMVLLGWLAAVALVSAPLAGLANGAPPCVLTSADTMEKVFRDEPWNRSPAEEFSIEAARNEVEGIQLVVAPVAGGEIRGATIELSDLAGEKDGQIAKANVTWRVVGYVETEKPPYATPKVGWWPDPLLPDRSFDVKTGQVQPIWINVRVPADAAAGVYRGMVKVRLADGQTQSVPLELRVWDFAVPKRQHLETCFPLRPGELQQFYKLPKVPIEMYEQWIDFCLEHRISINLCDWPDFNQDMERLAARQLDGGGSAFCLAYAWFTQGEAAARQKHNAEIVGQIKRLYDRAKQRGWIDRAYIYCHDEIGKEQFTFAHELYGEMKKAMPDLRLMQTFYKDEPVGPLDDVLDIWAPNTARYRQAEFQAQQAKGDGVWWYVCCGPGKPFANLMIEWPAVDHRVLLWQNWKYNVTGFLYWGLNVWRDNMAGEKRWPEVKWNPATWRNDAGAAHNGDGQLIYPGPDRTPLSSVRLENLRDGIEDYEYLWLLRDAVTRLKKGDAAKNQALIAESEKALTVDEAVVKDLTHFTDKPQVLRQARAELARLIERTQAAATAVEAPAGAAAAPPRGAGWSALEEAVRADREGTDWYELTRKVAFDEAAFAAEDIVAFEEHRSFVYAVGAASKALGSEQEGKPAARLVRRFLLLRPATVVIEDEMPEAGPQAHARGKGDVSGDSSPGEHRFRIAHEGRTRLLRVFSLHGKGEEADAVRTELTHTDGRVELTVTAGERTFRLILPPWSIAPGEITITSTGGKKLLETRPLAAGVLPHGPAGVRLLERWDSAYRGGARPGWDTGRPSSELKKAVEEGALKPCRVLELGCGTGTNAIFLAGKGFDVTAIDIAPTALSRAQEKAEQAGVKVRWLLADVLAPPRLEPFDLIYDRGCYHGVRQQNAAQYVEAVRRLSHPGTRLLILAGNANEPPPHYGPPRVKEEELKADFSPLFDFEWLRETRFDTLDPDGKGAMAWSVLLRRK